MRTSERRTGTIEYDIPARPRPPRSSLKPNGIRFAYRRFGQEGGTRFFFMQQHFRGGMDHWDPSVTDVFAKNRPVIVFDNAGGRLVERRGRRIRSMRLAEHAADFVRALGLSQIDLLGLLDRRIYRADPYDTPS